MSCRRAQRLLGDYAAGLLEGDLSERVRQHLDTCASCRERLDQFVALDRLVRDDRVQAGEDLVAEVMGRVHEADLLDRRWRRDFWGSVGVALTAATVTALAVFLAGSAAQSLASVEWCGNVRQLLLRPEAACARAAIAIAAGAAVAWVADRVAGQFA
jgi:predicted anti-sigma-YlaC factor YlaD